MRRALANTITKHGAPGTETRAALRATQAAIAARPSYADLAHVVAGRLDRYPAEGGIPSLDPIADDVTEVESAEAAGHPIPPHLINKASRALEAPVEELVARGVIGSGEVLARALPQISAQVLSTSIDDPELAAIHRQTYAAFRRRRSLLLLNLEHQVQLDELPWVAAMAPFRSRREDTAKAARQTLEQATLLALTAFPQTILPNPLVRELGALATQAGLQVPLVEEVAADIFMGTFTSKWRRAAALASASLADSLYARYYDLPAAATWAAAAPRTERFLDRVTRRWGKETADDFAAVCATRANEAQQVSGKSNYVASNGTVLEQSQILTTHNLAVLVDALDLRDRLRVVAPDLADRSFAWLVRRQAQRIDDWHATVQMVKNTAYAWRQAIFYLSFCDREQQQASVARLRERVASAGLEERLAPVVDGLAHVVAGGRFSERGMADGGAGRRFLGWSVGRHWLLPPAPADTVALVR